MKLYKEHYITIIVFTIMASLILRQFENRSTFKREHIVPAIVLLMALYIYGDWDEGRQFSKMDIVYGGIILGISYYLSK